MRSCPSLCVRCTFMHCVHHTWIVHRMGSSCSFRQQFLAFYCLRIYVCVVKMFSSRARLIRHSERWIVAKLTLCLVIIGHASCVVCLANYFENNFSRIKYDTFEHSLTFINEHCSNSIATFREIGIEFFATPRASVSDFFPASKVAIKFLSHISGGIEWQLLFSSCCLITFFLTRHGNAILSYVLIFSRGPLIHRMLQFRHEK